MLIVKQIYFFLNLNDYVIFITKKHPFYPPLYPLLSLTTHIYPKYPYPSTPNYPSLSLITPHYPHSFLSLPKHPAGEGATAGVKAWISRSMYCMLCTWYYGVMS
jgi:hypothetical protein